MSTISERLRDCENDPMWADHAEIPKRWCKEAADTIDALVAAAELGRRWVDWDEDIAVIDAALAKAKSCHTGNSARGNALKDEA